MIHNTYFIYTWEPNFQALISYGSLKVILLSNKINSFRNIIYPLELDLKFPTNSCWGQGGRVGFQCKIIPVNLAGSFIPSFIPITCISSCDMFGTKDTLASMTHTKNSPHFVDLIGPTSRWGENRNSANDFSQV